MKEIRINLRSIFFGVLTLVFFFSLPFVPESILAADNLISVNGSVVNGTDENSEDFVLTLSGKEKPKVILHVFNKEELIDTRSTVPDQSGSFIFENILSGEGLIYTLTTVYLGVQHSSPIRITDQSQLSNVLLKVYETTEEMDKLSFREASMLLMNLDRSKRAISVFETIKISNTGDLTFVPDLSGENPMNFIRFPLPSGAVNLDVQSDLTDARLVQVDSGFALVSPIPPGENSLNFTYVVFYENDQLDLSRKYREDLDIFRLLVSNDIESVNTDKMKDLGFTGIANRPYRLFSITNISEEENIDIVLSGLPQPTLFQRVKDFFGFHSLGLFTIALMAVSLCTVLILSLLGKLPYKNKPRPEFNVNISSSRTKLLETLVALDDRFELGETNLEEYSAARSKLKNQILRKWLENERQ